MSYFTGVSGITQTTNLQQQIYSQNNQLQVAVQSPLTAFGEVLTANLTQMAEMHYVYGINNNWTSTSVSGTGSASAANALLTLSTGASSSSTASFVSKKQLKYHAGQGGMARFTAIFTAATVGASQRIGLFDIDKSNGLAFTMRDTAFAILVVNGGSTTVINQSSWNVDNMDGSGGTSNPSGMTLDPTKGNVFEIRYQYLGFGDIRFYIENPVTGRFQLVHIIQYPNANTATSLKNPTFFLYGDVVNSTNTTNVTLSTASGALFLEGQTQYLGPKYAFDNQKSTITTATSVLGIRNCLNFNGVKNNGQIRIRKISAATASGGSTLSTVMVYRNATIAGAPVYTAVDGTGGGATITNGNSIASTDTAGTTITGGQYLTGFSIGTTGQFSIDVTADEIYANPGDILTFAAKGDANTKITIAVSWSEEI